jgi:hypothetical protein
MQHRGETTVVNNRWLAETGLAETSLVETGLATKGTIRASVTKRKRVEAIVETLANLRSRGESLAEVAHDTRNMVTALGL